MRKALLTVPLFAAFAGMLFSQQTARPEPAPADRKLVPRDFRLNGPPLSLKFTGPLRLYVNGREFPLGWNVERGGAMWLGLQGRGGYTLSMMPCYGYKFKKAGAILDHAIVFESDGDHFELRTSGPIAGSGAAWNLYALHDPSVLPKLQALFETFDWATCSPALRPLLPDVAEPK